MRWLFFRIFWNQYVLFQILIENFRVLDTFVFRGLDSLEWLRGDDTKPCNPALQSGDEQTVWAEKQEGETFEE